MDKGQSQCAFRKSTGFQQILSRSSVSTFELFTPESSMQIVLGIRTSDACGSNAAFRLLHVEQLLSVEAVWKHLWQRPTRRCGGHSDQVRQVGDLKHGCEGARPP